MPAPRASPELIWPGKHDRPAPPACALREESARSYCAGTSRSGGADRDNRLIFGDNLRALLALEPEFAGRIQCVYLDPPYNTGAAVTHYEDGQEHARWLTMMRDRLEVLRRLLRPEGVIFISIDHAELGYLMVLMDELFGRENSCGLLVWEKKKKPSFLDGSLGVVTEYILAYAKDRARAPAFVGGRTTVGKKYPLNNAGNGVRVLRFPAGAVRFGCPDQVFAPRDMSAGNIRTELLDRVEVRGGRNVAAFRLRGEWRYTQATLDAALARGETLAIAQSPFRPNHVKPGGAPKKLRNLLSLAHGRMSTYEDATAESRALFGAAAAFDYPKPEKLLHTLLAAVTREGDWVLDAFAGSGTTGAVAHKLRRQWIMVECGAHCHTHVIPRLKQVIDGSDGGGVTGLTEWKGGGAFRYFAVGKRRRRLAPSPFRGRGLG